MDFEGISDYCKEKNWSSFLQSADDISVLASKVQTLSPPPTKSQPLLRKSPKKAGVPDPKKVFQDKENCNGNRSISSSNKKKKKTEDVTKGKILSQKLAQSREDTVRLQEELQQKDVQLLETRCLANRKSTELNEMTDFVSTLQDLSRGISSGGTVNGQLDICPEFAEIVKSCTSRTKPDQEEKFELQAALKKNEMEVVTLTEHITQMLETLASQGNVIDGLKNLTLGFEQLIGEKDKVSYI